MQQSKPERTNDRVPAGTRPALARWEFAGLMLTYWCSARCAFCYVNAGPDQPPADMDVQMALELWRSLDRLAAAGGQRMRVHLAGGEPFHDWVRLVSIVRAARDAGLSSLDKVETNAFWATDDARTRTRLELLAALGTQRLVVSTDVFHQQFTPFERVRRCVETARQVFGRGRVIVRWWDFYNDPVETCSLSPPQRQEAFRAALARHRDRLNGRAAVAVASLLPAYPAEAFRDQSCVAEVLQSRHIHIDVHGNIFPGTCAGIILGRAGRAGRTVEAIWHELADAWVRHPVVAAVVAGGAHELLQRAKPHGYRELPAGYATKCHLCYDVRRFLAQRGLWRDYVGPAECYAACPAGAGRAGAPHAGV